jgi:hypothetical protein
MFELDNKANISLVIESGCLLSGCNCQAGNPSVNTAGKKKAGIKPAFFSAGKT